MNSCEGGYSVVTSLGLLDQASFPTARACVRLSMYVRQAEEGGRVPGAVEWLDACLGLQLLQVGRLVDLPATRLAQHLDN